MKKKMTTSAIVKHAESPVIIQPAGEQMDDAARINYYHRVSRTATEYAIRAALEAGVILAKVKAEKQGFFVKWIEDNCEFGRATAYKYLSLAEKVLSLDRLTALLEGTADDREAAVTECAANTDSKSLTELYCDYGIIKKTPSNLGGARPGAGRKKKETATELDAAAESPALAFASIRDHVAALIAAHRDEHVFARLNDADLANAAALLGELATAAREELEKRVR